MQYVEKIEPQVSRRLHLKIMATPAMEFLAIEKPLYIVSLNIFPQHHSILDEKVGRLNSFS
jgi:hypothetical protein